MKGALGLAARKEEEEEKEALRGVAYMTMNKTSEEMIFPTVPLLMKPTNRTSRSGKKRSSEGYSLRPEMATMTPVALKRACEALAGTETTRISRASHPH